MFTTTKNDKQHFDIKKCKEEAKSAISKLDALCTEVKNSQLRTAIESFLHATEITGYDLEEVSSGELFIKKYYLSENSGLFHMIENFSEFISNLLAEGARSDLQEFQYTGKLSISLQKEKAAIESCLDKLNVRLFDSVRFVCDQLISIVKQCEEELMLQKQKFLADHAPKHQAFKLACT